MVRRYRYTVQALITAFLLSLATIVPAAANNTAQTLPFSQDWSNRSLITDSDDWSGVPGVVGFLGQNITTAIDADPQLLLGESAVANDADVIANQTNLAITNGGVAEWDISDPVVALQGSATGDAPYLLIHVETLGRSDVTVSYNLRDIDPTADNAVQQVAVQYRVGGSGNFTNLPAGYVADATTGPSLADLVTPVERRPACQCGQPAARSGASHDDECGRLRRVGGSRRHLGQWHDDPRSYAYADTRVVAYADPGGDAHSHADAGRRPDTDPQP